VEGVVDLMLDFNRLAKTKVVVPLLEGVEVDLFVGADKLRCFGLARVGNIESVCGR
jgi:hypothetical protein